MTGGRNCCFLVPGDWHTPTGGFAYDRRLVGALQAAGWAVEVLRLDGAWPAPDARALAAARAQIEALPDGSLIVADGLAYGVLAEVVRPHATRLRWVALVHHPLHLESGLADTPRRRLRAGEARALALARQVIVTSRHTATDVAALGVAAERIAVVEPGTDPVPQPAARAAPGGPLRLLCVATLTPRKGHAVLLEALRELTELDWILHSVGSATRDPATAARLRTLAATPALAGRVVWHGALDAAALQAQYATADVFVLPSLHEGYGMAAAEALTHGLPVIASRAGALAQTLPPQAALQVPPGNALALRSALAWVIGDAALRERLAAGARAAAGNLPTWDQAAARCSAVLEAVA
jgi:glycosyltransferase involved in cell wall biosynthesis